MRNKLVYICSPYRGNVEENTENARRYSLRAIIDHPDVIPIAPHLLFTQYLDDDDPEQRRIGLDAGLDLLSICDELWVYGLDNPSEGMAAEIAMAKELAIPIRDGFNLEAYDPEVEDAANYGVVDIVSGGQSVYAEDPGILTVTNAFGVKLEAQAVFDMARKLRQYPGASISYTVGQADEEVQP